MANNPIGPFDFRSADSNLPCGRFFFLSRHVSRHHVAIAAVSGVSHTHHDMEGTFACLCVLSRIMSVMIRYSQIQNLPESHPLVQEFLAEQDALDRALLSAGPTATIYDESTLEYFDRYMAGDRK